jgi:glycosyltransferase involved in cell wall biosynthesis
VEAVAAAVGRERVPTATRVLLVSSRATGGIARHVIALLVGLRESGCQVAVACDADSLVADTARDRSLPVYGITAYAGASPVRAGAGAIQLTTAINGFRPQIVHTHSFNAGLIGALSTYFRHPARLVVTIHNYPPMRAGALSVTTRSAVRLMLNRAARVVTVSDALRRDLLRLRPQASAKSLTIPNGIDTQAGPSVSPEETRRSLGIPTDVLLVGMVARLAPQKGIREFLHASRLLCDRHPTVRAVLVGSGPLWEEAERLHAELGLGDRLLLVGEAPSAREIMAALDVLVVSSISEGSSVVAMEAMALSKPVAATSVGGIPEVVADGETGLLVPPGDPAALAEAVLGLLADPERAGNMGARGRARAVEHFDVRTMIARTRDLYGDVMREVLDAKRQDS